MPFGIILLVCLSYSLPLSTSGSDLSWNMIIETIKQLFTYTNFLNLSTAYQQVNGSYTFEIIAMSLGITLFFFILYAYFFPKFKNKTIKKMIDYLEDTESLPIVGVVLFIHWFSVMIYKATSIYLFKTVGTPREPAVVVPLVSVSIYPLVFLINYMTPYIKDVYQSNYFIFAKSLGYSSSKLFFSYVIPNLFSFLERILAIIYLEMITVMLFIEIQFNTGGLLTGLRNTQRIPAESYPQLMVINFLYLLLLPYFIMSMLIKLVHVIITSKISQ
ncbi:peptide transporter [Carnobacterium sp. TMP28]|uniref:peptide transporter n=1 Tax=Carnobacterium sp. TMP28 TaxID=3397060 RepID=UPI0039E0FB7E